MSEDTTPVPANLVPPDAGMVRLPDGSQIPQADAVQGPSDILTQYHTDTIPAQFPDIIERNRVAGLDAKGYPIPGATLSAAAQAIVGAQVPAPVVSLPVSVTPSGISTGGDNVTTHIAVPVEHVNTFSLLLADIESIPQHVRDFWHQHFGQHV